MVEDKSLTCSQVQGTSEYPDPQQGNASAGTPQTFPAVRCRPKWHEHQAVPKFQGTAGRRCPPCSLKSRCAGTGEGSPSTPCGSRSWVVGNGSAVDWAGTAGIPPGVHLAACPGCRRRGTGHPWTHCWPCPHNLQGQHLSHRAEQLLAHHLFLLFLLLWLVILHHPRLTDWDPEKKVKFNSQSHVKKH